MTYKQARRASIRNKRAELIAAGIDPRDHAAVAAYDRAFYQRLIQEAKRPNAGVERMHGDFQGVSTKPPG